MEKLNKKEMNFSQTHWALQWENFWLKMNEQYDGRSADDSTEYESQSCFEEWIGHWCQDIASQDNFEENHIDIQHYSM